jgi:pimeloyl-ACP methyl ester carboxylesterase
VIRPVLRGAVRAFGVMAPESAARWFERQVSTPRPAPQLGLAVPRTPGESFRVPFTSGELALTRWRGAGETVLLVHGWGGTSKSLWALVDPLVAAGFSPIALDLPAHGDSPGRRTTMPDCAEAVLRACRDLGPLHAAVSHSFGAPVTALAARRGLALRRLVMVAPLRSVHGALDAVARDIGVPPRVFSRMSESVAARFRLDWAELDTDRMAARLDVPLLVVHDEADPVSPWSHGAAIARGSRRGTLFTTAGLGHRAVLADRRVVERIVGFVLEREDSVQVAR